MVLSLASNPSCLLLDDELNILPTSSHVRSIEPLPADADTPGIAKDTELKGLSESLSDTLVSGPHRCHARIVHHHQVITFKMGSQLFVHLSIGVRS